MLTTEETAMQVDLVVFDVAGTTVEDENNVAATLRLALLDVGCSVREDACARVMGLSKPVALEALAAGQVPRDELPALVARAHDVFVERMVHHYLSSPAVRPIRGAETTFQVLRDEGIAVVLDTGFSRPIMDAILLRLGWYDDVVDLTVTSDEVEAGRPHPYMIQRAMAAAKVDLSARVMKVGDTAADMREGVAARAGIVVGVLSGTGSRAELEETGATHIIDDVSQLPRLVFGAMQGSAAAPLYRSSRSFGV
jgi:phosphonatase-like hydrolase